MLYCMYRLRRWLQAAEYYLTAARAREDGRQLRVENRHQNQLHFARIQFILRFSLLTRYYNRLEL